MSTWSVSLEARYQTEAWGFQVQKKSFFRLFLSEKNHHFFFPKIPTAGLLLLGFGALCLRRPGRQVAAPVTRVMFREFTFQLDALGKFDEQLRTGCVAFG